MSDELTQAALHAKQHEIYLLRDSMIGFLQDDLLYLVNMMREGLELDPPRIHYALEKIDDLNHAINTKLKELNEQD